MSVNEPMSNKRHPDDAAVAEVRNWLDGLDDEAVVQFKVRRLRGVLNVLDGWERNARGAAAQRNVAEGRLETARVDMQMLRADLVAANERAEEQAKAHDHWLSNSSDLETRLGAACSGLTVAAELIDRLAFDDECDYDHHDSCHAHNLHERPCPHPLGRQFVEAWRAVEAEQKEASDDGQ